MPCHDTAPIGKNRVEGKNNANYPRFAGWQEPVPEFRITENSGGKKGWSPVLFATVTSTWTKKMSMKVTRLSCDECGADLKVVSTDPLELESAEDKVEEEEEDEDFLDEDEVEEEEAEEDDWK